VAYGRDAQKRHVLRGDDARQLGSGKLKNPRVSSGEYNSGAMR
jgi:hypothetical protein